MQNMFQSWPTSEAQQSLLHPYFRLMQENIRLFTQFSTSPEIVSVWSSASQKLLDQALRGGTPVKTETYAKEFIDFTQESMMQVAQSNAFADLIKGVVENQARFFFDLAQAGMTVLGQEQAKFMRQMQEASSNVVHVANAAQQRPKQAQAAG